MRKSPDAFRTISEVADWLDVPTHVLRFWESKFSQIKPVKRAGGRRYYRPSDMELIGGIKALLHDDGQTIRAVQKILSDKGVKHVAALSKPVTSEEQTGDVLELPPEAIVDVTPVAETKVVEDIEPDQPPVESAEEEPASDAGPAPEHEVEAEDEPSLIDLMAAPDAPQTPEERAPEIASEPEDEPSPDAVIEEDVDAVATVPAEAFAGVGPARNTRLDVPTAPRPDDADAQPVAFVPDEEPAPATNQTVQVPDVTQQQGEGEDELEVIPEGPYLASRIRVLPRTTRVPQLAELSGQRAALIALRDRIDARLEG